MSDTPGTAPKTNGSTFDADYDSTSTRERDGISIMHEYACGAPIFPTADGLQSHETLSARGKGWHFVEAGYSISKRSSGSYIYSLDASPSGYELPEWDSAPYGSREQVLADISERLICHVVKLRRAHQLEREDWLDFNARVLR